MVMDIATSSLTEEVIRHLQALIRLDTSNPPGNESLVAKYLADVFRQEGLEPTLLEKIPGRANLVVRLKGQGFAPPLLLMGHTDVVPADGQGWKYPPFDGVIADGFMWGRGALDMKFMLAYELTTLLNLKRAGIPLIRDVIFAATADEEGFGADRCGMAFVASEYPELIRAEYALNEFGGVTTWIAGVPVYPIIVGEKAACMLVVRATGKAGHASEIVTNTAIGRLCNALARLEKKGLPSHDSKVASDAFSKIGGVLAPHGLGWAGEMIGKVIGSVVDTRLVNRHPFFSLIYGATHNTAIPTELRSGIKFNIIPDQAEAVLNGRFLPDVSVEEFVREVQVALGSGVSLELQGSSTPLSCSHNTPLFKRICETLEMFHKGSVAIPWLMNGGTDAGHVAKLGATVYGFSPIQTEPGLNPRNLVHAVDERIPLAGIPFGITAFWEVVRGFVL